MRSLTIKEKKILLILFKEFTKYFNANSISKKIDISRVGAMKILKKLFKENILLCEKIGKSVVYKIRLQDDYTKSLIAFILLEEANNFKRWKEEFKSIFEGDRVIILFGSTTKNYESAKDIDLLIIQNKDENEKVNRIIREKEKILPKRIHLINLDASEMVSNLKKKNKALIDIVSNSVILYGQNKYAEILRDVTSK